MCDIWRNTAQTEISLNQFQRYLEDFERLSVQWVVLSGGEPLMHSDLFRFCAMLRERRIRVTVLTTGLLLERDAPRVAEHVDDVIVSLDGPPRIHDRIRRVPGAYAALARGIGALLAIAPAFPISARSTVQRQNYFCLRETAATARGLGLRAISFLAADVSSEAFNRPGGWNPERQSQIALSEGDLQILEQEIEALITEWGASGFVTESATKLDRILRHFRAHLGLCEFEAPRCNAPWVSSIIETDGTVRPCFFHRPIGNAAEAGFAAVWSGPKAAAFREGLDVATNAVCRCCVCSLHYIASGHADPGQKAI
jgi:MoaA/NifB/PqqE/SkfB family radical SAM enzyme